MNHASEGDQSIKVDNTPGLGQKYPVVVAIPPACLMRVMLLLLNGSAGRTRYVWWGENQYGFFIRLYRSLSDLELERKCFAKSCLMLLPEEYCFCWRGLPLLQLHSCFSLVLCNKRVMCWSR